MEQLRESELVHFSNGVYHGFLSDGRLKELFGAFLWDNGDFYIGEWKKDKMHGRGILHFCGGGYIEGQFEESVVSGKAQFVLPNGDIFLGTWKLGTPQTTCFCLPAGSKNYKNLIVSSGKLTQSSEPADIKYINELKQQIDISGVFKKLHSSHIIDVRAAKRFARLNIVDGNTKVYLGAQRNGVPDGLGIITHSSSSNNSSLQHEWGYFHGGQLSGVGRKPIVQASSNQDYYLGQFLRGKYSGEGCVFQNDSKSLKKMYFKDGIAQPEKDKFINSQAAATASSTAQSSSLIQSSSYCLDRSTLPFFNRKKIEKIVDNNCSCSFDQVSMLRTSKISVDQSTTASLSGLTQLENLAKFQDIDTPEDCKDNRQINENNTAQSMEKNNNQLLHDDEGLGPVITKQTQQKADLPKTQLDVVLKAGGDQQKQQSQYQTLITKQSNSKNPSTQHQSNLHTLNLLYQRQLSKHKKSIKRADTEYTDNTHGLPEKAPLNDGDKIHTTASKPTKLIQTLQNTLIGNNILPSDIAESSGNHHQFADSNDQIQCNINEVSNLPQVELFSERAASIELQQQQQTRFQSQYSAQSLDPSNESANKQVSCFSMYLSPSQRSSAADLHNNNNNNNNNNNQNSNTHTNLGSKQQNGKIILQKSKLAVQDALKLQQEQSQKKDKSNKQVLSKAPIEHLPKKLELSASNKKKQNTKHNASSASKLLVSNQPSSASADKRVTNNSEQQGLQELAAAAEKIPSNIVNIPHRQLQFEKYLPLQSPSEMQHYYQTRILKPQSEYSDLSKEQQQHNKLSTGTTSTKPSGALSRSYNKDGTTVSATKASRSQQGSTHTNIVGGKSNLIRSSHQSIPSHNSQLNNLISKNYSQSKSMSQKALIQPSREQDKHKQSQSLLQKAKSFEIASNKQEDNALVMMREMENSFEKKRKEEVELKIDSVPSVQSLISHNVSCVVSSSADKEKEGEKIFVQRSIEDQEEEKLIGRRTMDRLSCQDEEDTKVVAAVEEAKNSISERIKQILSMKRTTSSEARNHHREVNENGNTHYPPEQHRQRFSLRNPKGMSGQQQEQPYYQGQQQSLKKIVQNATSSSGKVSAAVSPSRNLSARDEGFLSNDFMQELNVSRNQEISSHPAAKDILKEDGIDIEIEDQLQRAKDSLNSRRGQQDSSKNYSKQPINSNNKSADLESYLLKQQNQQQQQQQLQQQENKQSRSQNQKVSSYLSFQDRLNNIGQSIYKNEWSSFKTVSRDNTNANDKFHEMSEDVLNNQQQENIEIKVNNADYSENNVSKTMQLPSKQELEKIALDQCLQSLDKLEKEFEKVQGDREQQHHQPSNLAASDAALVDLQKKSSIDSEKLSFQLKEPIALDSSLENAEKSLENLIGLIEEKEDLNSRDRIGTLQRPEDFFFQGEKALIEESQELNGIEIRNFEDDLLNFQKAECFENNSNNKLEGSDSSRDHIKEGSVLELVIKQQHFNEDFLFASESAVKISSDLRNPCQIDDFDDYESPKYHEQPNSQHSLEKYSCERIIFFGENDEFQHQMEEFSPINIVEGSENIMNFDEDKVHELLQTGGEEKNQRKDIYSCVARGKYKSILESITENALEDKCTSPKLQRPRDWEERNEQQQQRLLEAEMEDIVRSLQF